MLTGKTIILGVTGSIAAYKAASLAGLLKGGEMAYTREDGVKVIPIGCLKD